MTCVWEPDTACLDAKWAAYDEPTKERALMLASSSLQMLTLYRVGTCPITIRPCPEESPCGCLWAPYEYGGQWFNGCCHKTPCKPLSEIDIPGPVHDIVLKINGAVVNLSNGDWRLDDGHFLVWQGVGPSPVPTTQNLNLPDTEVGTWSITYRKSYPVAADGRLAVARLAMEFAKACSRNAACKLPRGVSSVVRNGVSFTIEAGLFPNGLTNDEIVDAYILKWVPPGSPQRSATVFVPGQTQPRVTHSVPVPSP